MYVVGANTSGQVVETLIHWSEANFRGAFNLSSCDLLQA
jgi:hypothetical protein